MIDDKDDLVTLAEVLGFVFVFGVVSCLGLILLAYPS